jgi:hypothetical protein
MMPHLMSCDHPSQDTLVDLDQWALRTVRGRLVHQAHAALQREGLANA